MARRQAYLDQLKRILPASKAWETWLEETGELPPDFHAMPSCALLPDPLVRRDAAKSVPITTPEAWQAHRDYLKAQFHKWMLGTVPPAPDNLEAEVLSEREEARATVREVRLTFGPERKAALDLELLIPTGEGPFPVFMTQHNHRAWALIALRRGYLCCIYAGSDSRDDTDSFLEAYPDCDWSRLTRRAWAAGRCIDYLTSVGIADVNHIALTGHSRNGKQSLIAAALDERISVVIPSSSGQGGSLSTRYYSEQHFGEGIENITRVFPDWFHLRLRFFTGREHKVPVDWHELVALCAPRPCLLSASYNDGCGSPWAEQQTYLAVKPVYRLLGAEGNLRILWRPGNHETWTTTIERYLDWCDLHFGRGAYAFPERLIYPWDWESWRIHSNRQLDPRDWPERGLDDLLTGVDGQRIEDRAAWGRRRSEIVENVRLMLGDPPPKALNPGGTYGEEPDHVERMLGRHSAGGGLEKRDCVFGEYINGDIYSRKGITESGDKFPAVIWLHPFSFPYGYSAAYRRGDESYRTLARNGFVVFCFDQIGCGRRVEEIEGFYDRHPDWSTLGKMVRDTQAALDVVCGLPYVDENQVWLVGFGLGAFVGLHVAALDARPAGLVAVCGPPPFRLDRAQEKTGGIRRWSHLHMLLPRLGFFIGEEGRVPYDIHELLACVAPRPVLVVSPKLDREAPVEMVTQAVEAARDVYALHEARGQLFQLTPEDYKRFGPEMQELVIEWLRKRRGE